MTPTSNNSFTNWSKASGHSDTEGPDLSQAFHHCMSSHNELCLYNSKLQREASSFITVYSLW